jgi:hypothetical protein
MAPRARVIRFPKSPPAPAESTPGFAEVRRCRDQAEALVIKSVLESHGLSVVLRSHVAQSVHPFSVGDQGEITVLVPAQDAPRARRALIRALR